MQIKSFVKKALKEDIGRGDLFSLFAPSNKKIKAHIISKQDCIFCGEIYIKTLCKMLHIKYEFLKHDGDIVKNKDILLALEGKELVLLQAERVILNILQHTSSIATNTNKFVKKVKNIKVLDTRKTRPLLRNIEKYASRVGGGVNHRMGLDDCLMLKDTHIANMDNLEDFIKKVKSSSWSTKIECECENIDTARQALNAKVDILMCDNMEIDMIKKIVDMKNSLSAHTLIEASGNINLDNIVNYDNLGIDAISTGAMIHQATWVDFSMKIKK